MISIVPINFSLNTAELPPFWIFTSKNAVKSVLNHPAYQSPGPNEIRIAAIGHKTAEELKKGNLVPEIIGSNARELAKSIIQAVPPQSVMYFAGSRRREELPTLLAEANFDIKETIVYETQLTPSLINWKNAEGALFFSPSSVESFLMSNEWPKGKYAISIGPTTTDYLQKRNIHAVATAAQPTHEHLQQAAKQIFHLSSFQE